MPLRPRPSDLLAGGLAALVGIRAARTDGPWPTVAARAVLPWAVGPGAVLTLAQLARRRRVRAAVAAGLTAALTAWSWPDRGHHRPDPVDPQRAWRLVTSNMLLHNADPVGYAAALVRYAADVVVLQEISPEVVAPLQAGGLTQYPYQVDASRPSGQGALLASRYPLRQVQRRWVGSMLLLDVVVDLPHGAVRVWCVHTSSPAVGWRLRLWRRELAALPQLRVGREPLVLAGDLNATAQHAAYRQMVDRMSLVDAFERAGRGLGATFPVGGRLPVPVMRIDHVLVDDDIAVAGVRAVRLPGTDHRALVADLG